MAKKNVKSTHEQVADLIEEAQRKAKEKVLGSLVRDKDDDDLLTDDPQLGEDGIHFGEIIVDDKTLSPQKADKIAPDVPIPSELNAENIFRKDGDTWTLRCGGEPVRGIAHRKGLARIAYLLAHPNKEIDCITLSHIPISPSCPPRTAPTDSDNDEDAQSITSISGTEQEMTDDDTLENTRKALNDLQNELEKGKTNNDDAAQERIENEIEFIQRELKNNRGLGVQLRTFSTIAGNVRKAMQKDIRRTIEAIRKHHKALAEHLHVTIRTGSTCSYCPGHKISWQL